MADQASIILTDIEGTISDIAFVRNVLFPYARKALPAFVAEHGDQPQVRQQLEAAAVEADIDAADTAAIVATLQRWIDEDRKATPLKALQGMIWQHGYTAGDFTAHLYEDAYLALDRWHRSGVPLYVYSSGSVLAQQLYFGHSDFGDIRAWFQGFFDTTMGPKREAQSYRRIADHIGAPPDEILFLSDVVAELDAARQAGMQTAQLDRGDAETSQRHPVYTNCTAINLDRHQ